MAAQNCSCWDFIISRNKYLGLAIKSNYKDTENQMSGQRHRHSETRQRDKTERHRKRDSETRQRDKTDR